MPTILEETFDKSNDCRLAVGDQQLLELHRRTAAGVYVYDLQVYDHEDMIAFLGLTAADLHKLAIVIIELVHGNHHDKG